MPFQVNQRSPEIKDLQFPPFFFSQDCFVCKTDLGTVVKSLLIFLKKESLAPRLFFIAIFSFFLTASLVNSYLSLIYYRFRQFHIYYLLYSFLELIKPSLSKI